MCVRNDLCNCSIELIKVFPEAFGCKVLLDCCVFSGGYPTLSYSSEIMQSLEEKKGYLLTVNIIGGV